MITLASWGNVKVLLGSTELEPTLLDLKAAIPQLHLRSARLCVLQRPQVTFFLKQDLYASRSFVQFCDVQINYRRHADILKNCLRKKLKFA